MNSKIIPAGTYIKMSYSAGLAGTKSYTMYKLEEDWNEEDLANYAWETAVSHAESYGIYQDEYGDDNISGWFDIVDPTKHRGETFHSL